MIFFSFNFFTELMYYITSPVKLNIEMIYLVFFSMSLISCMVCFSNSIIVSVSWTGKATKQSNFIIICTQEFVSCDNDCQKWYFRYHACHLYLQLNLGLSVCIMYVWYVFESQYILSRLKSNTAFFVHPTKHAAHCVIDIM